MKNRSSQPLWSRSYLWLVALGAAMGLSAGAYWINDVRSERSEAAALNDTPRESSILSGTGGSFPTPPPIAGLISEFQQADDWMSQSRAAVYLVIGETNDSEYYDFLEDAAREAIESGLPSAYEPSSNPSGPDSQATWCQSHNIAIEACAYKGMVEYPGQVMMLARTGDDRARTLLLAGLMAPNFQIVGNSALGLALIGNVADIVVIKQKAELYPTNHAARDSLAMALYAFQVPSADNYANALVSTPEVGASLQAQAKEMALRLTAARTYYGQ